MIELLETNIPVKFQGKEYSLRFPTYEESFQYEEDLKNCGEDTKQINKVLFDYLEKLGLPSDMTKKLELGHLKKIIEFVSGSKKN